jgi:transcriptional regulator with PAS, ATPase and Fis domain
VLNIGENAEVILNSIDGFLMIDVEGRLVFMCDKLMKMIGVDEFAQIRGKKLRDVISTNKTDQILKTGERQIGVTYLVHGHTVISNAYPVFRDGALIGAIEYDVFEDADLLREFLDKMSSKTGFEHYGTAVTMRSRAKYGMDSIKGSSSAIRAIKNEILLSGRSSSTVLITGETGTGKELIAQAIHTASSRSIFEFVTLNCSSIPSELFESELFGYEEGSFTGARHGGKKGLVQLADKGTLFLDEVDTLPLPMQAKLLRFLQEQEIRLIGSEKTTAVDVRIICASNTDLSKSVENGDFRQDLYYRLNVINITAVALRDRRSDIPELINSFIETLNVTLGRNLDANKIRSIDQDALMRLMDYDWPGNVRELRNVIERAMNRCEGNVLTMADFPDFTTMPIGTLRLSERTGNAHLTLKEMRRQMETEVIGELLCQEKLSVAEAARRLGITRQMLYRKMHAYGMSAENM